MYTKMHIECQYIPQFFLSKHNFSENLKAQGDFLEVQDIHVLTVERQGQNLEELSRDYQMDLSVF